LLPPLLGVELGVGAGVGAGVGVGMGAGVVPAGVVENLKFVGSVPRTQARAGVHALGGLSGVVVPSALHKLLAAFTMERRRPFKLSSKDVVPCGVLEASAATGEQELDG